MKRVDDFRMRMGSLELVPIMIGGMGVDISSADLALEAARLGGVGHISDAMIKTVTDRRYKTKFVKAKQALYKLNVNSEDKSIVKFNLGDLAALRGVVKFPVRIKCATLSWNTLLDALAQA